MKILVAILIVLSAVAFSDAPLPESISYQGVLTDGEGNLVSDGEYTATFSLHVTENGGNASWSEELTFTTSNGVFNVILGNTTPFNSNQTFDFGDQIIWLEIHLEGEDDPLSPRIEITAVPYARSAFSVNFGEIDFTEIGSSGPAAATFTTVQVNTSVDINGGDIDGTDIGNTNAAAATFTDISTSSSFFYIPNTISEGMVLLSNGDGSASWTTFSGGTDLTASETITIPNSVSAGEVLTADGSGNAYWQENNSSRLKVTTLNASATLSTEDQFVIITNANYDVTLPSNPAEGQLVKIFTNQNDPEIDPNGKSLFVTNQEFTTSQSIQQIATDAYDGLLDGRTPTDVSFTLLSDGTDWYIVSHSFDTVGGP